jgi:glycosyltransferase involved in cell wall biosynthesis
VRYQYQENRGQPSASNVGLALAESPYIGFLDADDLYIHDKIALQMDLLLQNPKTDCVFGHVQQFISPELPLEIQRKRECSPGITPAYLAAGGLFRRECFEKVGPFNPEQRIGVFIEWFMRAQEKEIVHQVHPDLVLMRRIHESNMGISYQKDRNEYLRIIKSALQRRAVSP